MNYILWVVVLVLQKTEQFDDLIFIRNVTLIVNNPQTLVGPYSRTLSLVTTAIFGRKCDDP